MPHVTAAPGKGIVPLDFGLSVGEGGSLNVDITAPIAVAAIVAGNIVVLDAVTAPVPPVPIPGDVVGGDTAEAAARAAADTAEQTRATTAEGTKAATSALTAEAVTARAAEGAAATATALTTEQTRATSAEGTEATRAQTAEALLATIAALTAETTRATAAEVAKIPLTQRGAVSGVAILDGAAKISSPLPDNAVRDTAGTSAPMVDTAGNQIVNIPAWQPTTLYPAGFVVQFGGALYSALATFTSGGAFNVANWAQLGPVEMGYAEIVAGTGNVVAIADVAGLSIVVAVGTRPFIVEAGGGLVQVNSAGSIADILLVRGAATNVKAFQWYPNGVNLQTGWHLRKRYAGGALAPGNYTFKIQFGIGFGPGPSVLTSTAADPSWIQAIQL